MRSLTDPDDVWLSVGSLRTPQSGERDEASGIGMAFRGALQPVAWLRRAMRRVSRTDVRGDGGAFDVDSLIPALSSIRSSAEILRDTPDIDAAERRRFAEIVLAEEARLEALVARFTGASTPAQ